MHSGNYAFRDRRARKGEFRKLWIVRINAACRQDDISYSRFVAGLKAAEIDVDRKVLADLAVRDSDAFGALVSTAARRSKRRDPQRGPVALGPKHREVKRLRALLRDPSARGGASRRSCSKARGSSRTRCGAARRSTRSSSARTRATAFRALLERPRAADDVPVFELKEGVLEKLGSTRTPQPVLAVASIPPPADDRGAGRATARCSSRSGVSRSGQPRHVAAQRRGVGLRGRRLLRRLGRRPTIRRSCGRRPVRSSASRSSRRGRGRDDPRRGARRARGRGPRRATARRRAGVPASDGRPHRTGRARARQRGPRPLAERCSSTSTA